MNWTVDFLLLQSHISPHHSGVASNISQSGRYIPQKLTPHPPSPQLFLTPVLGLSERWP